MANPNQPASCSSHHPGNIFGFRRGKQKEGTVWILNSLTLEPAKGGKLYDAYGASAQAHIAGSRLR